LTNVFEIKYDVFEIKNYVISLVLEWTEFDLSKIHWLRGVIRHHSNSAPWGRFSLCRTPIRPLLAFHNQILILIVGSVITRIAS
jgi:hypothetical protein